jgi:hypothetical protein
VRHSTVALAHGKWKSAAVRGAGTHEDCDGQRGEASGAGHIRGAFTVAGENQEIVADQETLFLLKRFSRNPGIEKARAEFDRAQKVEERFHSEFDGLDFFRR